MNTYMNETTMNLVDEAIAEFNRRVSGIDTTFCKRFSLAKDYLYGKTDGIVGDLCAVEHLGYISHDEYVGIYGDIQNMRNDAVYAFRKEEKERIGEREYFVRQYMYDYEYTREEAEKEFEYYESL